MKRSNFLLGMLLFTVICSFLYASPYIYNGNLLDNFDGELLEEIDNPEIIDSENIEVVDITDVSIMGEVEEHKAEPVQTIVRQNDSVNNISKNEMNNIIKQEVQNALKNEIQRGVITQVQSEITEKLSADIQNGVNTPMLANPYMGYGAYTVSSYPPIIQQFGTPMPTSTEESKTENPKKGHLKSDWILSPSLNYWFIADKNWSKYITPVFDLDLMLGFPRFTNGSVAFSANLAFGYKFGLGKGDYQFTFHNIIVSLPFVLAVEFQEGMSGECGVGPYYQYDIMNLQDKYQTAFDSYKQNQFGIRSFIKFNYNLASSVSLFLRVNADIALTAGTFTTISVGLGVGYHF